MQKNYTQLLLGLLIGLLVGLLLGKFVFSTNDTGKQKVATIPESSNNRNSSNDNSHIRNTSTGNEHYNSNKPNNNEKANIVDQSIPSKVYEVLKIVKETGNAPDGYVGGRTFNNRERQLPMNDDKGNKIQYQEWDVNPKVQGQNRGPERMVTGSDGRSWFTSDHYTSFTLIKQ